MPNPIAKADSRNLIVVTTVINQFKDQFKVTDDGEGFFEVRSVSGKSMYVNVLLDKQDRVRVSYPTTEGRGSVGFKQKKSLMSKQKTVVGNIIDGIDALEEHDKNARIKHKVSTSRQAVSDCIVDSACVKRGSSWSRFRGERLTVAAHMITAGVCVDRQEGETDAEFGERGRKFLEALSLFLDSNLGA